VVAAPSNVLFDLVEVPPNHSSIHFAIVCRIACENHGSTLGFPVVFLGIRSATFAREPSARPATC
jgi:hypothetical protein